MKKTTTERQTSVTIKCDGMEVTLKSASKDEVIDKAVNILKGLRTEQLMPSPFVMIAAQ